MRITNRGTALREDERDALVRRIDEDGIATLRAESGLSRTALLNAAIGQPVLAGTRALVRALIAEDEDDDADDDADDEDRDDACDGDEPTDDDDLDDEATEDDEEDDGAK